MRSMLSILEAVFGSTAGDLSSPRPTGSQARSCAMSEGCSTADGEGTANGTNHHRTAVPTETLGTYTSLSNGEAKVYQWNRNGPLAYLLSLDEQVTTAIALYFARPATPLQKLVQLCCKLLEISGHGVPWFVGSFFLISLYYFTSSPSHLHYGFNMLLILVLDIVTVAPIKLVFKRPRPALNAGKIPLSISQVDQFAFPSGHASRCVALAAYFCYMPPFNPWTHLWYIWGLMVSFSRITFGRHHVLDVVAGMGAGIFIFEIARWSGLLLGTS